MSQQQARQSHFEPLETSKMAALFNRQLERVVNQVVRRRDAILARARLGGRKAAYDDHAFEFEGGPGDPLRHKHYDKSLRLLWKAED